MNIWVQVEYLVIEMVIGVDIIKEQICIVSGEKFSIIQDDVKIVGYLIECWINVENFKIFIFSFGIISYWYVFGGNGVCMDMYIYSGYKVLFNYDFFIGKLIIYGEIWEIVL